MTSSYFRRFEGRMPPTFEPMSIRRERAWHFWAGATVAAGLWYLVWRWGASLNPDAIWFSVSVAFAETLFFLGTLLFYFDIWREKDTPRRSAPARRTDAGLDDSSEPIGVDVFVTSFDESCDVVEPSLEAARALDLPPNVALRIYLLDDGDRLEMAALARRHDVGYLRREDNVGFKAGNLRNALFHSSGDFVVICDADTRLLPTFLIHTLGYFHDPKVAWVQTPHWFYDIPEGVDWDVWATHRGGLWRRLAAPLFRWLSRGQRTGTDPFLSDPAVFFDIIQRRRNRNGASFCCGAGSIHRRDAIFDQAMKRKAQEIQKMTEGAAKARLSALPCVPLEPYRFHVSEDIYTSILLHGDVHAGWTSVFHPQVEARMLSPWSLQAWATQRLKYAGGTFDILLRENPVFKSGMRWPVKFHYAATFWSYLSVLWAPILLLAPAVSLMFGITPVEAYSIEFFVHFLPAVAFSEIAMMATCKGYNLGAGRTLSMSALPINLRALSLVARGKRPQFPTTPKKPGFGGTWPVVWPNVVLIGVMISAGLVGAIRTKLGYEGYSASMLWTNLFWLIWNVGLLTQLVRAAFWHPALELAQPKVGADLEVSDDYAITPV